MTAVMVMEYPGFSSDRARVPVLIHRRLSPQGRAQNSRTSTYDVSSTYSKVGKMRPLLENVPPVHGFPCKPLP